VEKNEPNVSAKAMPTCRPLTRIGMYSQMEPKTPRENLVSGGVYSHPPLNASKKVQKLQSMRYLRDKSGGDSIVWACNFKPIGVHF
jgi:hypothetical protein